MKLSKLYSNQARFEPIYFKDGLNVVYGDIEDQFDQEGKVLEHNLGKTSLVGLIDFLLLKRIKGNDDFIRSKDKFAEWVFFLEIKLNNGGYLTIRRSVASPTKISFKKHFSKDQNLLNQEKWDFENLSINSTKEEQNPITVLQKEYLQFDVISQFKFRQPLALLLREQGDYSEVFKVNKFQSGKDKDWKPLIFQLLGYQPSVVEKKYDLDSEISEDKKYLDKKKAEGDSNEIYTIKELISSKEREKNEIKEQINKFDFYSQEDEINMNLVRETENQIAFFNKQLYYLNSRIEQLQQSLDVDNLPSLSIKEVKLLFEEVGLFFPEQLSQKYDDVINFSKQITKEREKFLKEELDESIEKKEKILDSLQILNNTRQEKLSFLTEEDTFKKYTNFQENLIQIEGELVTLKQKLENAKSIETYQEQIERKRNQLKELSASIKKEIDEGNDDAQQIKAIFQDIYKKTFKDTVLLVIEPNKHGNVEFKAEVVDVNKDITGQDRGNTSKKVLCASFVLSLLFYYSSRSFFRFAYHDGILGEWADKHKITFVNLIRDYCKEYDTQYIISLIKSEIPKQFISESRFFQEEEIIKVLSENKTLYGFNF